MFLLVEINSEVREAAAPEQLYKVVFVKKSEKLARKYLCWSLFFEK